MGSLFTRYANKAQQTIESVADPVSPYNIGERKIIVEYVRINENACTPYIASEGAAGMDLCAVEAHSIPSMDARLIATGLQIALPDGHYGRIAPRSGLAIKHHIDCFAGVIDPDYRGEVKVLLFNFGRNAFQVNVGDRIAQLICEKISHVTLKRVTKLDDTPRGSTGFGSTGTGYGLTWAF